MLAERIGIDMDDAFARLRSFARNNNRGLTEVAEALVAGTISLDSFNDRRASTHRPPPPPGPDTRNL